MSRTVVIIGAGRSGRGMLGELYSRSGFHIIFADKDKETLKCMQEQQYYTVGMTNLDTNEEINRKITGFSCIDVSEKAEYYRLLNEADIISTAILPRDFDAVIQDLAEAIKIRYREEKVNTPMLITLGANYVGMKSRFSKGIERLLTKEEAEWAKEHVALLQSIVNRKNLLPGRGEETEDKLRVIGDNKGVLQVEKHPALEAWTDLPEWMILKENLEAAMAVKIWSNNVVQGSMAAVGMYKGYTDTYSCAMDEDISKWAFYAGEEGYEAVRREFGLPKRSEADAKKMVGVFRNAEFKDSCYRIIRNPIRKLARNERFIGAALCALEHGVVPYFILKCCAYMFLYQNGEEPESVELQKEIKTEGVEKAIEKYCQLDLQKKDEKIIADLLKNFYLDIAGKNPVDL